MSLDDPIITAAFGVFSRYGTRKSTMGDIAEAAGVSRQTLYNRFENKDDVLRACVRQLTFSRIAQMTAQVGSATDLPSKLEAFFEAGPLHWYDLICAAPDSADLVDGLNTVAQNELAEGERLWHAALEDMLTPHSAPLGQNHMSARDMADFIYSTAINAKHSASDRTHFEQRLNVLKTLICQTLSA